MKRPEPVADSGELVRLRRELHAHPELSGEEHETAARVRKYLRSLHPDRLVDDLGGCGLAAVFEGSAKGPRVLFRAELDALPIREINDFPHRSVNEGLGHKCGHDGHMAILLGLGCSLAKHRPERGAVILLFQPAEETGEGAARVLTDPGFQALQPDYVFALHNLPGFPAGAIVIREGAFTASVKSLIIRLEGKTAHAAEPENGINPAPAMAAILQLAAQMSRPHPGDEDFAILTPVHAWLGEKAYGVAAGYGEVHLTLRTWTESVMEKLCDELLVRIRALAGEQQLKLDTEWLQVFRTTRNEDQCVARVRQAAARNGLKITEVDYPFRWGEDFGAFTQAFPGAMFGLGAGVDSPALHNPDYDFPDELIETGVLVFRSIADDFLNGIS